MVCVSIIVICVVWEGVDFEAILIKLGSYLILNVNYKNPLSSPTTFKSFIDKLVETVCLHLSIEKPTNNKVSSMQE